MPRAQIHFIEEKPWKGRAIKAFAAAAIGVAVWGTVNWLAQPGKHEGVVLSDPERVAAANGNDAFGVMMRMGVQSQQEAQAVGAQSFADALNQTTMLADDAERVRQQQTKNCEEAIDDVMEKLAQQNLVGANAIDRIEYFLSLRGQYFDKAGALDMMRGQSEKIDKFNQMLSQTALDAVSEIEIEIRKNSSDDRENLHRYYAIQKYLSFGSTSYVWKEENARQNWTNMQYDYRDKAEKIFSRIAFSQKSNLNPQ